MLAVAKDAAAAAMLATLVLSEADAVVKDLPQLVVKSLAAEKLPALMMQEAAAVAATGEPHAALHVAALPAAMAEVAHVEAFYYVDHGWYHLSFFHCCEEQALDHEWYYFSFVHRSEEQVLLQLGPPLLSSLAGILSNPQCLPDTLS